MPPKFFLCSTKFLLLTSSVNKLLCQTSELKSSTHSVNLRLPAFICSRYWMDFVLRVKGYSAGHLFSRYADRTLRQRWWLSKKHWVFPIVCLSSLPSSAVLSTPESWPVQEGQTQIMCKRLFMRDRNHWGYWENVLEILLQFCPVYIEIFLCCVVLGNKSK